MVVPHTRRAPTQNVYILKSFCVHSCLYIFSMAPSLYLAALLLAQLLAGRAEIVNTNTGQSPMYLLQDSELLDIVLVASVDGQFHALNRSTGHVLWSKWSESSSSPSTGTHAPESAGLLPLVNTSHPDVVDDGADQELYIIEPQSGDIYILPAPSTGESPLQRFPFSVPELVDMSPFSFASDPRSFVGWKETRMVGVDIDTGKARVATDDNAGPGVGCASAICSSHSYQEVLSEFHSDVNLEGTPKPTEVFIDRTDYHVTIHHGASNQVFQTLSFSTYGPHQRNDILQEAYKKTKDNQYMQSAPNGIVLGFDGAGSGIGGSMFLTGPVVAIFDVLRKPGQGSPFVLVQPRPPSSALLTFMSRTDLTPYLDWAYVGIVEEPETPTGSLFVMTPDQFPLGAKYDGGRRRKMKPMAVPRPGEGLSATPRVVEQEYEEDELRCELKPDSTVDRRCLVGMHPLQGGDKDGSEML
ncbi:hypothetical protein C8F04DRAFT_1110217 [Mycena alexandri]|uniref:Uncharacterized protein n=1 Tax=Mycena alexandri TaxID=1745969 RepID=A0AAD6STV0_9AGAR|nr:hypothetical protein C8F04DRAFT_1110217 [Mycena alexandri]